MAKQEFGKRPLLELLLLFMGFGGIGLTLLVSVLLVGVSAIFAPGEGAGVIGAFIVGVVGFTAGVGLISLSYILGYLRIIASGSGIERTFE
jgi:hypothetical protein